MAVSPTDALARCGGVLSAVLGVARGDRFEREVELSGRGVLIGRLPKK